MNITISMEEYYSLVEDQQLLYHLIELGVEQWEHYQAAVGRCYEEDTLSEEGWDDLMFEGVDNDGQ